MTVSKSDSDGRLNNLEIKIAHQEQQINDLSEMVSDQWKLIDQFKDQLLKADARIESLENSSAETLIDEKPPHY